MTRRDLFRLALAVPATSWFARYNALAAPHSGKVKITGVKAMQLSFGANNTLIKIETDAGLAGHGEAGSSGDMARTRILTMNRFRIGQGLSLSSAPFMRCPPSCTPPWPTSPPSAASTWLSRF